MNKLIEKAKSFKSTQRLKQELPKEEIELALAFVNKEITFTQLQYALKGEKRNNSTFAYAFLTQALSQYIRSL